MHQSKSRNKLEGEEEDKVYNELYNNSIQSSLMVFPNQSFGLKNSDMYFSKSRYNSTFISETTLVPDPSSPDQVEHNLKIVKKYSVVYHDVIQAVLEAKELNQCVYVYSERINGSGILRCVYLLSQFFNYHLMELKHQAGGRYALQQKRERCVFLNEIDEKKTDIMSMIKAFNDPSNRFGEYIRVIFGTDKTTEGITLKNIQQIHIVTPGWNFGKKNQATGRGIRFGSHDALKNAGVSVNVKIYLHCVLPNVNNSFQNSVSFLQYTRGEYKEINILFFLYQLLITAMDCQLNYYQNFQEFAKDYTASCYFQKCKYPCLGISDRNPTDLFYGNYNTFYLDENHFVPKIVALFENDPSPKSFERILSSLSVNKDLYLVYNALQIILNFPVTLFINGIYYLLEQEGIFYCAPTRDIERWNNKAVLSTITAEPNFLLPDTLDSVKNKLYFHSESYLEDKMKQFKGFLESKKTESFVKTFLSFPKTIQQMIIKEQPDLAFLEEIEWIEKKEKWITKDKSYELDKSGHLKKIMTEKEKQISQEEILKNNPYGVYAILTKSDIKIRDISTETKMGSTKSKTSGQSCATIDTEQIIYYIFLLQDKLDEDWKNFIAPTKAHLYKKRLSLIQASKNLQGEFEKQQRIFKKLWGQRSLEKEQMEWFLILKTAGSTRPSLCSYLLDLLRRHNLVLTETL